MECLEAQLVLSEAFDGETVDVAALAEARRHAAVCTECSAFHVMLSTQRAMRPQAPETLVNAIARRVREEAEARDAACAEAREDRGAPGGDNADARGPAQPESAPSAPAATAPRRPRVRGWRLGAGLAAGLALIVGFGALTNYGIGQMAGKGTSADDAPQVASRDAAAPQATGGTAAQENGSGGSKALDSAGTPRMIALKGLVYRAAGSRGTSASSGSAAGTVHSALDGGTVRDITAYSDPESPRGILLATEDGEWLSFTMVTRAFGENDYALTVGGGVERFGDWPHLPAQYPEPSSSDGSPAFADAGKDDLGVTVYAPQGRDPSAGFAVAPGTGSSDPAMGNPYWTWWTPLQDGSR